MTQPNKNSSIEADYLQLARIALSGRTQDVQVILRRVAKRYAPIIPELAAAPLASRDPACSRSRTDLCTEREDRARADRRGTPPSAKAGPRRPRSDTRGAFPWAPWRRQDDGRALAGAR